MADAEQTAFGGARGTRFVSLRVPLISVILMMAVLGVVYLHERMVVLTQQATEQQGAVEATASRLERRLGNVYEDLGLLASLASLRSYANTGAEGSSAALEMDFVAFANTHPTYDQLRFIDMQGRERLRVDWGSHGALVRPAAELQDKSDRYYVRQTLAYGKGQVYVSPLDLNVEHGVIEHPLKPMLRFGTPIHDDRGEKVGILVLNYLGSTLLEDCRAAGDGQIGVVELLNGDGYWLESADPDDSWGFMFDRPEQRFGQRYPTVWERMQEGSPAHISVAGGSYSFTRFAVVPPEMLPRDPKLGHHGGNHWWLVARLSPSGKAVLLAELNKRSLLFGLLALVLTGFASWQYVRRVGMQVDNDRLADQRRHAEQWRRSFDAIEDMVAVVDGTGRVSLANLSLRKHADVAGVPASVCLRPYCDADGTVDAVIARARTDAVVCASRATGRRYEWRVTELSRSIDGDRSADTLVVAIRDITEAHLRQLEIKEARTLLERAQEVTETGSWRLFHGSGRMQWSGQLLRMLEYSSTELEVSLELYYQHFGDDEAAGFRGRLQTLLATRAEQRWIHRLSGRNGTVITVQEIITISSSGSQGDGPVIDGIVCDITTTQALEDQVQHLERLRAVGQLAGGIAHDFNNQLTGVLGYAQSISRRAKDDPKVAHAAEQIIKAACRSADLTSKLLAFSRKTPTKHDDIDMHAILNDSLEVLERGTEQRIRIERDFTARLHHVTGDTTQLQSAVLNLCINARDAMPDGGTITVRTEARELEQGELTKLRASGCPGTYISVSICDTGTGIPEALRTLIFEPFFTTKDVGKGTGMGLPAVDGTVRSHGGALTLESTVEVGTTFTMLLPVNKVTSVTQSLAKDGLLPGSIDGEVLVIDDEAIVRSFLYDALNAIGLKVFCYEQAGEALACLERQPGIGLVLMDLLMPETDPEDLLHQIKRRHTECAVVLMSGHTGNKAVASLLEQGARSFLPKPLQWRDLQRTIRAVFDPMDDDIRPDLRIVTPPSGSDLRGG